MYWPGAGEARSQSAAFFVQLGLEALSASLVYRHDRNYFLMLLVGVAGGGAFEYVRVARADEAGVRARRLRISYDVCYLHPRSQPP